MEEKKYGKCPECGAPCEITEGSYKEEMHDVHYVEHKYKPQQGAVWVKASDRLPKPATDKEVVFINRTHKASLIWKFTSDLGPALNIHMDGWALHQWEWLDESGQSEEGANAITDKSGLRETIEDIILSAGKHNQEQCTEIADAILRESGQSKEGKAVAYDDLYRLVFSNLAKLRSRTSDNDRMVSMADNIREIIEDVTNKMLAMPQTDNSGFKPYLVQSESKEGNKEREVAFAEWADANYDGYYKKYGELVCWKGHEAREDDAGLTSEQLWNEWNKHKQKQ